MKPDPAALIFLGLILLSFALATAFAYFRGRRDEATRIEEFKAEWDRRAWLAGRRSMRYDLSQIERTAKRSVWRN